MKRILITLAIAALLINAVESVFAQRAHVNAKDSSGWTELMHAAYYGQVDRVKELIASGADLKAKDKHGETALVKAVFVARTEKETYVTTEGTKMVQSPLSGLVGGGYLAPNGRGGMFRVPGAPMFMMVPNNVTRQRIVPIEAGAGNVDCVKALIAAGADLNARDRDGMTTLIESAAQGNVDCVKALIAAGADLKARSKTGQTALMAAVQSNSAECVKALIAAGANPNVKDRHGKTALMLAKSDDVAALLRAAGTK